MLFLATKPGNRNKSKPGNHNKSKPGNHKNTDFNIEKGKKWLIQVKN